MRDQDERVILVDESDREIGEAAKLDAHERGVLHRAFSVFVVNREGEVLLQRRAEGKYHGGGLWSNSCCGHPRPGEETGDAARRRLREEMGIDLTLEPVFFFTYRAEMANGLTEHEIDHVFVARFDGDPAPDPAEVGGWRWADPNEIAEALRGGAGHFTPWLEPALAGLLRHQASAADPRGTRG